jgi:hypothetical protein
VKEILANIFLGLGIVGAGVLIFAFAWEIARHFRNSRRG